jgi:hypothetical protein
MLGLAILGGAVLALVLLWSEPKWGPFATASLLIAGVIGGMLFMAGAPQYAPVVLQQGQLDETGTQWLGMALFFGGAFAIYAVLGFFIVIFRGASLRAKQKRDDAELEAELARQRQGSPS